MYQLLCKVKALILFRQVVHKPFAVIDAAPVIICDPAAFFFTKFKKRYSFFPFRKTLAKRIADLLQIHPHAPWMPLIFRIRRRSALYLLDWRTLSIIVNAICSSPTRISSSFARVTAVYRISRDINI